MGTSEFISLFNFHGVGITDEELFLFGTVSTSISGFKITGEKFFCCEMHLAWASQDDIYRSYDDIYTSSYLTHGLVMDIWEHWIPQVLGLLPL